MSTKKTFDTCKILFAILSPSSVAAELKKDGKVYVNMGKP